MLCRFDSCSGHERFYEFFCPGGGTGRHASLRGWCLLKGVQVQILFWAHGAQRGFGIEILSALCVYIGTHPIFATFASAQQSLHTGAGAC